MRRHADDQAQYEARQKRLDPEGWRARRREKLRRERASNPLQYQARNAVWAALRAGRIVRPSTCQRCGWACKPQASHTDYAKPLDVEWLCLRCHVIKDRGRYSRDPGVTRA